MKKRHLLLAWRVFTIFMMLVLPFGTTGHGVVLNSAHAAAPSDFPEVGFPSSGYISLGADAEENGCSAHRNVLETSFQIISNDDADDNFLYLRMETADPAGWSTSGNSPARYKWFFDTVGNDGALSGGNIEGFEYLLATEDPPANSNDGFGAVTLYDSSLSTLGGPEAGTGTAAPSGPQAAYTDDFGYKVEGNYVDMYVRLSAIGSPASFNAFWATDQENPNLDQAPNCDRPDSGAFIALPTYELTVEGAGTGSGNVSHASVVDCDITAGSTSGDCSEEYVSGTNVTLTAAASDGSTFDGWSGDCDENGNVVVSSVSSCTATFSLIPAEPEADLTIEKTVSDDTPTEQDEISYQINIENPANQTDTATNVVVTDVLPDGVTFVSASATQGSYDEESGEWEVGDLDPGQGETLTITVTVDDETGETTIDNTAEITESDIEDPNSDNDSSTVSITVTTLAICGNGEIETPETCDDGELNGTPNNCNLECTGTTSPVCGNDVVEEGETCDDGELNGTPNNCNVSCTDTTAPVCGNDIIEAGENCDDGELNGDPNQCNLECTGITGSVCGNDIIEEGEICDDGELNGTPNNCSLSCDGDTAPICGNDVIEEGETCDDGELNGTPNNCSNSCDGTTSAFCGNDVIEEGETCDDGELNGDPNQCSLSCDGITAPICGNEVIEEGEECDGGEACNDSCEEVLGMICGYKYHDSVSENASLDEGEVGLENWTIELWQGEACEEDSDYASEVVTFEQGNRNNGTDVDEDRSDSSNALGAADGNFVSLGFGGELIVSFDTIIVNQSGDDLEIIETTNGGLTCDQYPETVEVYASQDGETWVLLGESCLDGTFDLGELDWASHVKLVDVSSSGEFNSTADGFDLDAIRALNCSANTQVIDTEITDEDGYYCFEEVEDGEYRVLEVQQEGWFATDSEYYDVTVDNDSIEVNFFNAEEKPADYQQISGYKYHEIDGDPGFTEGDEGLEGWSIWANSGETTIITVTDADGRYELNSLSDGLWTVWEIMQSGWKATTSATTTVEMISGIGVSGVNFGNVHTECSDGIDNDGNQLVDSADPACHTDGDPENEESYDPDIDDEVTYECSDGIDNDEDGLTDGEDPACHTDGDPNDEDDSYDPELNDESDDPIIDVCANIDGVQETVPEGHVQDGENCVEEDTPTPPTPPGGGGGGGGFSNLIIHTERTQGTEDGSITVTVSWHTNKNANSRVVWDTESHDALNESAPNYGYANSTETFDEDPKVTFHSVTIPGLDPNTTYYFRPISASSPEVYGIELEFTTSSTEEPTPEEPTPTPTPTPTDPGTPTGGAGGGDDEDGTVAGAEFTGDEDGTVAGVEFVEEAQAQEVNEEEEEETVVSENCLAYIWILLILNLIALAYAASKSKEAKKSKKNLWWIMAILVIVPTILGYPQCWLVVWLLITLILAIALVVNLNKKEDNQEANS